MMTAMAIYDMISLPLILNKETMTAGIKIKSRRIPNNPIALLINF